MKEEKKNFLINFIYINIGKDIRREESRKRNSAEASRLPQRGKWRIYIFMSHNRKPDTNWIYLRLHRMCDPLKMQLKKKNVSHSSHTWRSYFTSASSEKTLELIRKLKQSFDNTQTVSSNFSIDSSFSILYILNWHSLNEIDLEMKKNQKLFRDD